MYTLRSRRIAELWRCLQWHHFLIFVCTDETDAHWLNFFNRLAAPLVCSFVFLRLGCGSIRCSNAGIRSQKMFSFCCDAKAEVRFVLYRMLFVNVSWTFWCRLIHQPQNFHRCGCVIFSFHHYIQMLPDLSDIPCWIPFLKLLDIVEPPT